ncbi:MAG: hypothetical protein ABSA53_21505 [Streptosporangiaceae bacterium]
MGRTKPPTPEPVSDDPTPAAKLTIKVGPSQLAEGIVPPEQARHLITTFGILGCVFAGVSGAVLTLHIAANLTTLAFAELVLALTASVLIAWCGRKSKRGSS